ncbi:Ctf8-domain-containing protein [Lactarius akahatsu]|uniref:Ctf8-domain-containing protein n=1 Tax=Lactarius akahatsu TaxID=416441 RepID=A0AAD4QD64_9AGAM|nr:Ctf8-domain-containing protein [Lactarius akahatsu]
MIVPLILSSGPSAGARTLPPALAQLGSSELFLLELQGDLEVSGDKRGQLVGHLTIDDSGKGKPTLRIGYHLLEGTIVSLAKPLAVLQRPDEDISMHCGDDGGEELGAPGEGTASTAAATATSYTIRTLVRKKIVFSKRPTPIVGASAKIGVPL